ncbi:DNA cytosine methyltransferase [Phormidium sp. CCY1219]|uniref:DNA cytosine methyltransferase n=1 Tax=Phormidium sp. CCY1219 TaxID=2886104 RepID=UPI002D1F07A2|nr:DNA cytosine methyltransferase [Phormidium sp. CCY1219]MEB3831036.1 DNA cytosine methyltransferase [Phormidium sp. CCY1219]
MKNIHLQKHFKTAIDLFAGAGGLSLGLHMAGWNVTTAIENEKWAIATYQQNFPATHLITKDARKIDFTQFQGIDLVAGGPPCQPFSVAGKQLAKADPRDRVPEFIRAVKEIRPPAFLMENVPGLQTTKHIEYSQWLYREFRRLGYSVYIDVLDAASYGVPQHRDRLFFVGFLGKCLFEFPEKTHGKGTPNPYISAGEALADVPADEPNTAKVTYAKNPVLRPSPWAGMLVNGQGRPINLNEPCRTIPATAGGNRTPILDPDGILLEYHQYLMKGGMPKSGTVEGVRRLTVRECARAQSFPDTFTFVGSKTAQYKQIGNAVPPKLAKAVAEAIYHSLYPPTLDDRAKWVYPSCYEVKREVK